MHERFSISGYLVLLVATVVLFAAALIGLLTVEYRKISVVEELQHHFHRPIIDASVDIEEDFFRTEDALIQRDSHDAQPGEINPSEVRDLIEQRIATMESLEQRFGHAEFAEAMTHLTQAFAPLRDALSKTSFAAFNLQTLRSEEAKLFLVQLRELRRLHASASAHLGETLPGARWNSVAKFSLLSLVILVVGAAIVFRMMANINAMVAREREAGRALRESRERVQAILDFAGETIITIDERGHVGSFNRAAEKIFGYTADEVIGRNIRFLMPDPHRTQHDGYLKQYRDTGVRKIIGIRRELEGLKKSGEVFLCELVVSEAVWDGQRMFVGILLDISVRRNLEEQLRQSQKMEAIGRLAGGVAHDFNNQLTAINGYSEMLLEDKGLAAAHRADIVEILRAGKSAQELTSQLLAFSRQQILQPKVININAVIARLDGMLRRIIGEDIVLQIFLSTDCRNVCVDAAQVEQIVMNLVVNARDAMPGGGGLTLETSEVELDEHYVADHPEAQLGRHVRLSVSDMGQGMDEATRMRVFEPFFTTKDRGKGTGLGLATVYGIVKQSGGNIHIYSEPGRGTTVNVYFPAVDLDVEGVAESESAPSTSAGAGRVLVVDDDRGVRSLVRRTLERAGYQVTEAESPAAAIILAESGQYDLLLTDVIMPGMNGHELAVAIKKTQPGLRVLYMSGYTDNAIVHHGVLDAGVHFIHKPFTPDDMARKVAEILRPAAGA